MLIQLRDEAGHTIEQSFARDDMDGAADFCMDHPEYGITYFPENGEHEWAMQDWQAMLDSKL